MLEGLIHAYFDAFEKGWAPRDLTPSHLLDSPRSQTALSSFRELEGNTRHVEKLDRRKRRRFGPRRLFKLGASNRRSAIG